MKRLLISLLCLTTIASCSIQGTYKNRFNDSYGAGWIKIHSDSTFEYVAWGHLTGYGYTKGSWKRANDSIYLTEFEPKLPKTNELIEINNGKKNIKLTMKDGTPLISHYLKINGVLDSIQSDWGGNYSFKKTDKVNRIEVFSFSGVKDKRGPIIADFITDCDKCSYRIIVDFDKIGFKSVFGLDSIWIHKKNRLYPIDSTIQKLSNGKIRYYKKTDTVKPFDSWVNSWSNMKNGFD